jgi:hypothetical protein
MNLERLVKLRDAVNAVCEAIDAGELVPTEAQMVGLAQMVQREGGPMAHDLICQIAARCEIGRQELKKVAS